MQKKYYTEEERKEANRIKQKKYREQNTEKLKEYRKKWKEDNTDRWKEFQLKWRQKDGYWRVYLLPYEMYVGQTSALPLRMCNHKNGGNKNTTDYIILHICDTEREARDLEKIYHDLGFNGRNAIYG